MDFLELMQKRRSVRSFKEKEIPQELLDKILEAVRIAPSAGNIQSYKIKITKDREVKEHLVKASFGQKFIAQAPIVIAFLLIQKRQKSIMAIEASNYIPFRMQQLLYTQPISLLKSLGLAHAGLVLLTTNMS